MCGAFTSGLSSAGHSPAATRSISRADADHRVDEAVDLAQVLRLGRLDHERAGDGEAHRRRVQAEVDQALGDVLDRDAGLLRDRPQVEDALVRDERRSAPCRAPGSARSAAARCSWRSGSRPASPGGGRRAPSAGCRPTRSAGCWPSPRAPPRPGPARSRARPPAAAGWFGQEAPQVRAHGHGPDAGPAAAVRDAERLVQVQVRDVGAELAGLREADERVEVGAVDVDLPARVVHEPADVARRRPRTRRGSTGR